jgi:hypothetical protein
MHLKNLVLALLASSSIWLAAGCATPGAPQPPSLNLPRPVEDLQAERKGGRVLLTWTEPTQTTDRQNLRRLGATRVCRAVGQFPMQNCSDLVKELPATELQTASAEEQKLVYEDVLPRTGTSDSDFMTYAIEVRNNSGRSAGLSNQVRVSLAPTLPPPTEVKAEVLPDAIRLSWAESQHEPLQQSLRAHYRVLRRPAGKGAFAKLEEIPASSRNPAVLDHAFEWEQTYEYKVTPITEVPSASGPIEIQGEDSPVVKVSVHDVFPPARPTAAQAVFSGVGQRPFIDITWAPNTELDLAGYNVYRRERTGEPHQVNTQLLKAPSYRDEAVQPGATYFYSVSAVDLRGNQSPRSEETSEKVPEQ